ncbi:GDP-mannose 4,6-dehydratase [Chloroflexota bacterium]
MRAFDSVLKHKEPLAEPINFGNGSEVSILDLANLIIDACGKKGTIAPVHVEPRIGEVNRLIADASKAKNLLNWEPKYDLKKGLTEFIRWYQNYGFEERIRIE